MTTDRPPRTPTGPTDPRDLTGPFRHELEIAVRFADTDAMGHVNNATYLTYCEGARLRYWTDVTGEPVTHRHVGAESLILAEARITYRAQVFHTDVVGRGEVSRLRSLGAKVYMSSLRAERYIQPLGYLLVGSILGA